MAHDVNLRDVQDLHDNTKATVYLTDLGHAIIKHILPRQQKQIKRDTRRKGTARGRERERKRQLEIERALRQPGHWRNTVVDFIRPDGRIEAKDVGWCIDNKFKKVRSGKFTDAWAGNGMPRSKQSVELGAILYRYVTGRSGGGGAVPPPPLYIHVYMPKVLFITSTSTR